MKWFLHFCKFVILWSLILFSSSVLSKPFFQKCVAILSKIRKNGKPASENFYVQNQLRQLKSTHMSSTIQESDEYNKAIVNFDSIRNKVSEYS